MDEIEKRLKEITDSTNHSTWQGGIFALENLKRSIDSEIFKLKNLCDSTDIGKTMNRIEEKTNEDMRKENK